MGLNLCEVGVPRLAHSAASPRVNTLRVNAVSTSVCSWDPTMLVLASVWTA